MKKLLFTLCLYLYISVCLNAQTNTFPTSGNVGIGTTSPNFKAHIVSTVSAQALKVENNNGGYSNVDVYSNRSSGNIGGYRFFTNGDTYATTELNTIVDGNFVINTGTGSNAPSTRLTVASSGNVGIGTNNPTEKLEVLGNAKIINSNPILSITGTGTGAYQGASMILSANGVSSGNEHVSTWFMTHRGTDGTATIELQRRNASNDYRGSLMFYRDNYGWDFRTADNLTSTEVTSRFIIKQTGNVGIGTTSPDAKLTVKGNIHTNEVKVDLLGAVAPDYVFYKDYDLKSLQAVEDYIANYGHLPNIPSAKDMETEGIMLKEMNLKLLEKIEELTLYAIQQEKETISVKEELQNQEIINENLEKRLQKIEALLISKKQ